MRLPLYVLASSALIVLGIAAVAPGCRDATQVTLDISLSERALCTEIHGTAITVGVDAADTEARVAQQFVTASTSTCDTSTRAIGTLVVTPGDTGRASVIVVAAYTESNPVNCKPPLYKGCIVARRRFVFPDHKQLSMPIRLDPECADVPCDAFSTCRTGKCFESEIRCDDGTCPQPGALQDGGTSPDVVIPDTGTDAPITPPDGDGGEDAGTDAPSDGATDAAEGSTADPVPYCSVSASAPGLHCRNGASTDVQCAGASVCCDTGVRAADCDPPLSCTGPRYCCFDSDCGALQKCLGQTSTKPGRCNASDAGAVTCKAPGSTSLQCPAPGSGVPMTCAPPSSASCCQDKDYAECQATNTCGMSPRYCCSDSDCGIDGFCAPPGADPMSARTCQKGKLPPPPPPPPP